MAQVTRSFVDRLTKAGLIVVELDGWQARGETDGPFGIRGVLLHHDGMGLGNDNVPHDMAPNGHNGAQVWIGKGGRVYILAAGRKWHAGSGPGWGSIPANRGNDCLLGIETDHTFGQPWPPEQYLAIVITTQCAVAEYGIDVDRWVCGHREYAPGRKPDPENFDLDRYRADVKNGQRPPDPPTEDDDMALFSSYEMFVQHVNYGVARAINNNTDGCADFIAARVIAHMGGGGRTYTVQPGDTLGAIAAAQGVTVADLVRWNGIANPDAIAVGQVLRLG